MRQLVFNPFAPLFAYSLALTALFITYLALGQSPSPGFETLSALGWPILLVLAITNDAHRRRQVPCFDFGMFCYLFFPISVPWYLFRSRGWWGVLLLAGIIAIWLGPYLVAAIVWVTLYGGV